MGKVERNKKLAYDSGRRKQASKIQQIYIQCANKQNALLAIMLHFLNLSKYIYIYIYIFIKNPVIYNHIFE